MPKTPATAIDEKAQIARAQASERMRRSRDRHRKGLRCYRLELRKDEITALVGRGLLASAEQNNRAAVLKAMYAFLDRTLGRAV